ncbi:hypothetical protein TNCV_3949281 [Trichonephila clavipes]|nr:hypothetical protein TNCV_3949281 [Trichonephila clavipes]
MPWLKSTPVGVVWKLEEGMPSRVSSSSLDRCSKLRGQSPKARILEYGFYKFTQLPCGYGHELMTGVSRDRFLVLLKTRCVDGLVLIKSVELNVLPLMLCGGLEKGVPVQISTFKAENSDPNERPFSPIWIECLFPEWGNDRLKVKGDSSSDSPSFEDFTAQPLQRGASRSMLLRGNELFCAPRSMPPFSLAKFPIPLGSNNGGGMG